MKGAARLRRQMPAVLTVVVVGAAAGLWHQLPAYSDVLAPFDINGAEGKQVSGRTIDLTVTGARTAPKVQSPPRQPVSAVGEWVIVGAELLARSDPALPHAELRLGPNTYIPSERFLLTSLGAELAPGIPQRGSWVFDVAPDLLDPVSPMSLRVWTGDGILDSRFVVPLSVSNKPHDQDTVVLDAIGVGE